ncbi:hypothetical protein [Caulobacter sp. LARHSG274]
MNRIAGLALGLFLLSTPALAQEASPPPQLVAAVDPAKILAEARRSWPRTPGCRM